MGASLAVHHHLPHDADEYGASEDLDGLLADLRASLQGTAQLVDVAADLGDPAAVEGLVRHGDRPGRATSTSWCATTPTVGTPSTSPT